MDTTRFQPASQPETLPHCQMSHAALQTQNDNKVHFFFKEREKEAEGGRKTVLTTNFSLALFPDLRFWHGWQDLGQESKKTCWAAEGFLRVQNWSPQFLVRPAPRTSYIIVGPVQNENVGLPCAKMFKDFKRKPVEH